LAAQPPIFWGSKALPQIINSSIERNSQMTTYQPHLYEASIKEHGWTFLSERNLIVGVEANSIDEREAFCDAMHCLATQHLLIVCPESMVDYTHSLAQHYVNKFRPVLTTILRAPDEFPPYHPRLEWHGITSTIRITTPQRLFDHLYPSKDQAEAGDLGWVPTNGVLIALGLDRCSSQLEQGMFELVLLMIRRAPSGRNRQIILLDRCYDLKPIAERANADMVRFDHKLKFRRLMSALLNEEVTRSILTRIVDADIDCPSISIRLLYCEAAIHLFDSSTPLEIMWDLTTSNGWTRF
jgi:hypothetical protein